MKPPKNQEDEFRELRDGEHVETWGEQCTWRELGALCPFPHILPNL